MSHALFQCVVPSRSIPRLACVLAIVHFSALCSAQEPFAIRLDKTITSRWRFGVEVSAEGSQVTGIVATLPVPMDWPEQKVKIVEEDVSAKTKVSYRVIEAGVKQMVVTIPKLADGETSRAIVTFEIEKSWIESPEATDGLRIPKSSARAGQVSAPSPYIESNDSKIKTAADSTGRRQGRSLGPGPAALHLGAGQREIQVRRGDQAGRGGAGRWRRRLRGVIVAVHRHVPRAARFPARAVWVPGHTYPEFYFEDSQGKGHWYPCQAAGEMPDFGRMPEDRPILQKGRQSQAARRAQPQHYAKQTLRARTPPRRPR